MDHDAHAGHVMHMPGHTDHKSAEDVVTNVSEGALHDHANHANTVASEHIHDADHSGHAGMGHSMTFHGGCSETVLFSWWSFASSGGLVGSAFCIFVMAVLYEGLKYYREYLFWRTYNNLQYRAVQPPEEKATPADQSRVVQPSMWSKTHAWQTTLHAVQVSVSYLLMLIFMTYNSWLCLAVVLGAATGNFLFGWKKSVIVDVTEHCH